MREFELHSAVTLFLAHALPPSAFFFHVPNGEYRPKATGARLKRMGTVAGIPDILIVWNGHLFGIELKAPKRTTSDEQKATHARLRAAGSQVVVCRSLAEVELALRAFGIPLTARVAA